MTKKRQERILLTPGLQTADFAESGEKLAFWKQILPKGRVHYKDGEASRMIDFDDEYLTDCVKAFHRKEGIDQTMFQLANSSNGHGRDFDPERQRAEVVDMAKYEDLPDDVKAKVSGKDGLYAKMRFFDKKAARAVRDNPGLGVSARVRENFPRWDGKTVKRAVIHVLGTIDPKITGMSPWTAADLSYDPNSGVVLDLSNETYEGHRMAGKKSKTKNSTVEAAIPTDEEIDAFTDEELEAFLALGEADLEDSAEDEHETEDNNDAEDSVDASKTVGASLSNKARTAIDLANAQAAEANRRALDAQKRQAKAEFKAYRTELILKGVPPERIDLAMPVLARPDEMVVDLSNTDDENVNVAAIVRTLLEGYEGTIDMSSESGHSGEFDLANGESDPDDPILEAWDAQYPVSRGL